MKLIIILVFIIVALVKYANKNNANKNIGNQSGANVTPKNDNTYYTATQGNSQKSANAFKEISTYQTSQMVNEPAVNRDATVDVINEFTKSYENKKAQNEAKKPKPVKEAATNKAAPSPYAASKPVRVEQECKDKSYGWGIFDDFAASDALYLARKDVELRNLEKVS